MISSTLAVVLASVVAAQTPAPGGLSADALFNGMRRPVWIDVPPVAESCMLVLMNADGNVVAEPVVVQAGPVDLAAAMPVIWRIRRSCYLQLFAGEEPVGSALVLQPMLSRMVPQTRQAVNPNGIVYTEISGWVSEMDRSSDDEKPGGRRDEEGDEASTPIEGAPMDPSGLEGAWFPTLLEPSASDTRVFTGLRIYPEQDVVMNTTLGTLRIAMRPDHAPNTAWNFLELCRGGFYRDVVFHRVVPMTSRGDPFVIQAGDPGATGDGGPGYWLPIEPSRLPHAFGVISMARDVPPDSAGSQFFICLSREGTARLDGHYCSFGYAVEGADTIQAIAGVRLADIAAGRPVDAPVITSTEVVPAPPRGLGTGRPDDRVRLPEPPLPEPEPDRLPR